MRAPTRVAVLVCAILGGLLVATPAALAQETGTTAGTTAGTTTEDCTIEDTIPTSGPTRRLIA